MNAYSHLGHAAFALSGAAACLGHYMENAA